MKLKKGSAAAKAFMAKIRAAKGKKFGSTLYLEKNEKTNDPIKKAYRIDRDSKGRIKKYNSVEIKTKIKKPAKEKYFYKLIFDDKLGKSIFTKYKVVEQFDALDTTFFRTTGDRSFTEGKTGLSFPMDLLNLRTFKSELLKGENGQFARRLKDFPNAVEGSIRKNGISPLYN
jgi:hypothetical protein